MELFREPNFNFLRWKWHCMALSLLLLAAGIGSLVAKGGPRYGIDFKGGTLVYLKFGAAPDADRIRAELREEGLASSTIQQYGRPENHEVIIGLEQQGSEEEELDTGRQAIVTALRALYAVPTDQIDLNNLGTDSLRQALLRLDPIGLADRPTEAEARYREIAERIVGFRDGERGGLLRDFEELRGIEGVPPVVVNTLKQQAFLSPFVVRNAEVVGPKVGQQLRQQALMATALALGGVMLYIGLRFRQWVYGSAAVIAVFHDVLITGGVLSLFNYEFNLNIVAALLSLVGFSVNDTIVTFDRVRENTRLRRRERFVDLVNCSINQTLSRTALTSGLTFLTVLALFFLGGEVLHGFAFTLVVGTLVGTYSSIFIASPIVVGWIGRRQAAERLRGPAPGQRSPAPPRRASGAGRKGR